MPQHIAHIQDGFLGMFFGIFFQITTRKSKDMRFNTYKNHQEVLAGITINGIDLASSIKMGVKRTIFNLQEKEIEPCLATILVGDNIASTTYVKKKHDACLEVGIATMDYRLREDVTQKELNETIEKLNSDKIVHGILLQLPLPEHLNHIEALSKITPDKDVDGLTAHNMGLLAIGKAKLIPCTPLAIMTILEHQKIDLAGKTIVVINRSNLIGKPLMHLLLQRNATVIICHSHTKNIAKFTLLADVVISAVGNRQVFEIKPDMLKEGCALIDVAISRHDGKLTGDAEYSKVITKISHITPVPGGVGPMTVAMLLKNTIIAAANINNVEI